MHDLGRFVIALASPDAFKAADPLDFLEDEDIPARERRLLGTDHCFLGSWFAKANKLPAPVIEAIQHHHHPVEAKEHQMLVALVATADHIANHLQRRDTLEAHDATRNPGLPLLMARWNEAKKADLIKQIPTLVSATVETTASKFI